MYFLIRTIFGKNFVQSEALCHGEYGLCTTKMREAMDELVRYGEYQENIATRNPNGIIQHDTLVHNTDLTTSVNPRDALIINTLYRKLNREERIEFKIVQWINPYNPMPLIDYRYT